MIIIPAIDLKGGKCVRLRQGRADYMKVYSDDPVDMAKHWVDEGGKFLHVVDLDGAFDGHPVHTEVISRIVDAIDIPVEVGGGLRNDDHIRSLIDCGVSRAIIGTRAFSDPDSMEKLASEFGEKLAVGIDARNGMVQVEGWVETTSLSAIDLAQKADAMGVSTIIYTDTATDGMMTGPNVEAMAEMCDSVKCNVVASGGVTVAADVKALAALERTNLSGVIVGKALYEGTVTLSDIQG